MVEENDQAPDQTEEKRIIVDEDYKAQVQAEKERAAREQRQKTHQRPGFPEASLSILLTSLGTQALIAMGLIPNPITQKSEPDLEQARHVIDTLGVLEQKTKGNLTPDEKQQLDSLLFDLRMQYVAARAKAPQASG